MISLVIIILDQINKINVLPKIKKDKFSNKFFITLFRIIKRMRNFKHKILSRKKILTNLLRTFEVSSFTINELDDSISKFCNLTGYDKKNYKLKEIYPGCFCLEKIV